MIVVAGILCIFGAVFMIANGVVLVDENKNGGCLFNILGFLLMILGMNMCSRAVDEECCKKTSETQIHMEEQYKYNIIEERGDTVVFIKLKK